MPDYKKSKIYSIRVIGTELVYIGSTTNSLCRRMTGHRDTYKKWKEGRFTYCSSYKLFDLGEPYIELIEEYPCDTKEQLHKREGELIRNTPNCINQLVAGRTDKEWREENKETILEKAKLYRETHKEQISITQKKYREANKESIREYQVQYTTTHKEEKNAYDLRRRIEQRERVNQKQRENYAKRKLLLQKKDVPPV